MITKKAKLTSIEEDKAAEIIEKFEQARITRDKELLWDLLNLQTQTQEPEIQ